MTRRYTFKHETIFHYSSSNRGNWNMRTTPPPPPNHHYQEQGGQIPIEVDGPSRSHKKINNIISLIGNIPFVIHKKMELYNIF